MLGLGMRRALGLHREARVGLIPSGLAPCPHTRAPHAATRVRAACWGLMLRAWLPLVCRVGPHATPQQTSRQKPQPAKEPLW